MVIDWRRKGETEEVIKEKNGIKTGEKRGRRQRWWHHVKPGGEE